MRSAQRLKNEIRTNFVRLPSDFGARCAAAMRPAQRDGC
jgi:hypothetical protein